MRKNEKGISAKDASNTNLTNGLTMQIIPNNKTKINAVIHFSDTNECSFCWRVLPNDSIRFNGTGACPHCFALAHQFVDELRRHTANYFQNSGGGN